MFCVDNKTMQEGIVGAQHLASLNMAKWGVFDLVPVPGSTKVTLRFAGPGSTHAISGDLPISAYWIPYLVGGGLPGWVDIPRRWALWRIVLTAAMQGCALVVTSSPASPAHFRVFHNQHPEMSSTWTANGRSGHYQRHFQPGLCAIWEPSRPGRRNGQLAVQPALAPPRPSLELCLPVEPVHPVAEGNADRARASQAKPILDLPTGV